MQIKVITEDGKTFLLTKDGCSLDLSTNAFASDGADHSYMVLESYEAIEVGKESSFLVAEFSPNDGDPFTATMAKVKSISVSDILL